MHRSPELQCFELIRRRVKSKYAKEMPRSGVEYYTQDFDVSMYTDASVMAPDYLLYSFLRKWEGWGGGRSARDAAVATWKGCEQRCFSTNMRLRALEPNLRGSGLTFILNVRAKIKRVLGTLEPEKLASLCRWSGGATFRHKRGVAVFEKQKLRYDVTSRAENQARNCLWDQHTQEIFGTPDLSFEVVRGSRCVTVPKTAKTDRMISAEPSANAFLQQGVGRWIRHRLKDVGINLDSQEANQDAAFRAMVDGLATLDLSSASDTVSCAVVEMLLPKEWSDYLNKIRSHYTLLDGKWYLLEKFSPMGNAFTFELETLLFWALARTVVGDEGEVLVYGDDIIIPQDKYDDLVSCLTFFGFEVNKEKSFSKGSFFESCGKHYFDLEDVTPVYQKKTLISKRGKPRPEEYIRLYNRLVRWGVRVDINIVKDALNFLRKEMEGISAFKGRVPCIPYSSLDTGILRPTSEFKMKDGQSDMHLVQWLRVPKEPEAADEARANDHKSQLAALSLKLRDSSIANSGPDGSVRVTTEGVYRLIKPKTPFWTSHFGEHGTVTW